jgi:hypothetical protein
MVTKHLTDEEIQLFAFNKTSFEPRIAEHIDSCPGCNAKVRAYQLLLSGLGQQSQPVFNFDLSATVLEKLPPQNPRTSHDRLLTWIIIFICAALLGTVFYLFRGFLNSMFKGIAGISVYLIVVSAITVIIVLFIEMQKDFKKEMRVLDLY